MEIKDGGLVIIKGDNIENGGLKIVKNYGGGENDAPKTEKPLTDEELKERIERVRRHITINRLWFPVCKYMMWRKMVAEDDFVAAVEKLQTLYTNLKLDAADLARLNVLSFRYTLDKWDANNSPVGKNFGKYLIVAELMSV